MPGRQPKINTRKRGSIKSIEAATTLACEDDESNETLSPEIPRSINMLVCEENSCGPSPSCTIGRHCHGKPMEPGFSGLISRSAPLDPSDAHHIAREPG